MTIEIPYSPRVDQRTIHEGRKRFSVAVCHRRFGKTVCFTNELIRGAVSCKLRAPRFAYLAPLYKQAKAIAWDYLKHFTGPIPGVKYNEAELRCDLPNGARVMLLGADNPDALRGIYLDGVVLDEYPQMVPRVWTEVIRPALSDRNGWAMFGGTPRGKNHFWELYRYAAESGDPEWAAFMFRASETGIIDPTELDAARLVMSPDEYAQEFECSFEASIVGAYYSKALAQAAQDGRLTRVPYESRLPVHTAWDLGIGDSTAIWFVQQSGREVRLIDFYEASGVGLEHYVKVLREKPYVYGEHLLPHDVQVTELGSGKTRIETLHGLGLSRETIRVIPALPVDDGINAARVLLPRCWFDAAKCDRGLEALKQYRREWDEKGQVFRARPLHDWSSHAADAFRYLALGIRDDGAEWAMPTFEPSYTPSGRGKIETCADYDPLARVSGW